MAKQEDRVQLKKFEDEAILFHQKGNILGALEVLDKAIEIEKRWYHLYVKAGWLYYTIKLLKYQEVMITSADCKHKRMLTALRITRHFLN